MALLCWPCGTPVSRYSSDAPTSACPLQGMLSDAQFAETFARSKWRQARWAPSRIRMVRPHPAGLLAPSYPAELLAPSLCGDASAWCARRSCRGVAWPRGT